MIDTPPLLDIGFTCWNRHPERFQYFQRTVEALTQNLDLSGLRVNYIVSCESEGNVNQEEFESYCEQRQFRLTYHLDRPNLGGNLNHLFGLCRGDMVLYVQDDWRLDRPLALAPDVRFLLDNPGFAAVRYYVVDVVPLAPQVPIPGRPDLTELRRTLTWFFTDNPCLRRPGLDVVLGPYSTLLHRYAPELDMNERVRWSPFRVAMKHDGQVFGHLGAVSSFDARGDP